MEGGEDLALLLSQLKKRSSQLDATVDEINKESVNEECPPLESMRDLDSSDLVMEQQLQQVTTNQNNKIDETIKKEKNRGICKQNSKKKMVEQSNSEQSVTELPRKPPVPKLPKRKSSKNVNDDKSGTENTIETTSRYTERTRKPTLREILSSSRGANSTDGEHDSSESADTSIENPFMWIPLKYRGMATVGSTTVRFDVDYLEADSNVIQQGSAIRIGDHEYEIKKLDPHSITLSNEIQDLNRALASEDNKTRILCKANLEVVTEEQKQRARHAGCGRVHGNVPKVFCRTLTPAKELQAMREEESRIRQAIEYAISKETLQQKAAELHAITKQRVRENLRKQNEEQDRLKAMEEAKQLAAMERQEQEKSKVEESVRRAKQRLRQRQLQEKDAETEMKTARENELEDPADSQSFADLDAYREIVRRRVQERQKSCDAENFKDGAHQEQKSKSHADTSMNNDIRHAELMRESKIRRQKQQALARKIADDEKSRYASVERRGRRSSLEQKSSTVKLPAINQVPSPNHSVPFRWVDCGNTPMQQPTSRVTTGAFEPTTMRTISAADPNPMEFSSKVSITPVLDPSRETTKYESENYASSTRRSEIPELPSIASATKHSNVESSSERVMTSSYFYRL